MSKSCIICVAITGSLTQKANNPAVPITLVEQVESTNDAFEVGACIIHAPVRNDHETLSTDHEKFARLKGELEKHPSGMLIQSSIGGRSGAGRARERMLQLCPEMISQSVGLDNFPTEVCENPTDLVDR